MQKDTIHGANVLDGRLFSFSFFLGSRYHGIIGAEHLSNIYEICLMSTSKYGATILCEI
jgi:hypothetical protein